METIRNPLTNRKVVVGGRTHTKLMRDGVLQPPFWTPSERDGRILDKPQEEFNMKPAGGPPYTKLIRGAKEMVRNPLTNRKVVVGGRTHKKLIRDAVETIRNPLTNRKVVVGGRTHTKLIRDGVLQSQPQAPPGAQPQAPPGAQPQAPSEAQPRENPQGMTPKQFLQQKLAALQKEVAQRPDREEMEQLRQRESMRPLLIFPRALLLVLSLLPLPP